MNIKVFTRSINRPLYHKAMALCSLPFEKVRMVGTTADGYLYRVIEDTSADYAINIDEDAFITDNGALQRLIDHCIENGYVNCGMPDGGVVDIRKGNPLVVNPFFNVLHTALLRQCLNGPVSIERPQEYRFERKEMLNGQYDFHDTQKEPYYPLFIWMANHYKTLYLRATTAADGVSTILYNHLDEPFIIHTWFSREYNKWNENARRIDRAYRRACSVQDIHPHLPWSDALITLGRRAFQEALRIKKNLR